MDKNTILDYVTETPGNTNRAVLESMLDSVGSGSSLPEVTEDDNGKVLTVVDGAWDKASGGDGGFYIINVTLDEETGDYTADKTITEVRDAYLSGQIPVINYVQDIFQISHLIIDSDFAVFEFEKIFPIIDAENAFVGIEMCYFSYSSNEGLSYSTLSKEWT